MCERRRHMFNTVCCIAEGWAAMATCLAMKRDAAVAMYVELPPMLRYSEKTVAANSDYDVATTLNRYSSQYGIVCSACECMYTLGNHKFCCMFMSVCALQLVSNSPFSVF